MTLQLADAPGDLQHAWIEISQIYLVDQSEGEDGRGVVLMEGSSGLVDLLTLASTTAELVRDIPMPAGTYSQLRLVINSLKVDSSVKTPNRPNQASWNIQFPRNRPTVPHG